MGNTESRIRVKRTVELCSQFAIRVLALLFAFQLVTCITVEPVQSSDIQLNLLVMGHLEAAATVQSLDLWTFSNITTCN
jgi:hypothetical protein